MEQAGVTITNTKGIYYEWIRDVPGTRDVETKIRLNPPPGVTL
jgi:hypothetical protein